MALIFSYRSIVKSYGGTPLFSELSINLSDTERLGLIGGNGSGKSTLLKLICGIDSPEAGEKFLKKNTQLVYLPQEEQFDTEKTVEETLMAALDAQKLELHEKQRRIQKLLGTAGFTDPSQGCNTLSGGWKKKLAIIRALSLKPDLLLLDEPTNHLDINEIIWLENLLKRASFAYVVVSHDRAFLDAAAGKIMELGLGFPDGHFTVPGSYKTFVKLRNSFIKSQLKHEDVLSNKMRRETEWLRQGAKARTTKARFRIDQAKKLGDELSDLKTRNRRTKTVELVFSGTQRKTKKLLTCANLKKSVGSRTLFKEVSFELRPGMRLGLVGMNGSGKTTFMNLLEKRLEPDQGKLIWAENLKVAVFDQSRSRLDPEMTLKQALSPAGESVIFQGRSIHVISWAKRFLFTPGQLTLPIERLSGGERAKVLLANLMLQPADLLLLDEPTNDLDIPSLEVLEKSLTGFPGAVVVVSHDRYFLDRVTTAVLHLDGKGGAGIFADYAQSLKAQQKSQAKKKRKKEQANMAAPKKVSAKFSFKHKFELEQMEEKILGAEAEVSRLQAETQIPDNLGELETMKVLYTKLTAAQEAVDKLYTRWDELETLKDA